jgi:hypothetical protein
MSKIVKHRENIFNFITTKSCFSNAMEKEFLKEFIDSDYSLFPIAMMSVFSTQIKKNKIKSYHTFHAASALILMIMVIVIDENKKYYENKYGESNIKKIKKQATIFIFEAMAQNIRTMKNTIGSEISSKVQEKISSILHEKLLLLTENNIKINNLKVRRSDIIKYKFDDKDIIDTKYRNLKRIDKNDLVDYIDNKYCAIGQCSFVFGWLFGMGNDNQKSLDNISKIGASFGILIKLTSDFCNLENDIKLTSDNEAPYNFVANYGIHESFRLYDENKVKFIEGCITNELFSSSIKELVEKIDKTYDKCLKNTELELQSQYSSFISDKPASKLSNSTKEEKTKKN